MHTVYKLNIHCTDQSYILVAQKQYVEPKCIHSPYSPLKKKKLLMQHIVFVPLIQRHLVAQNSSYELLCVNIIFSPYCMCQQKSYLTAFHCILFCTVSSGIPHATCVFLILNKINNLSSTVHFTNRTKDLKLPQKIWALKTKHTFLLFFLGFVWETRSPWCTGIF